jgi:hypothetical protein
VVLIVVDIYVVVEAGMISIWSEKGGQQKMNGRDRHEINGNSGKQA